MAACAGRAAAPTAEELLGFMKIDASEKANLMAGKIVSKEIGEGSDKELAVGVLMFVRAPIEKLVDAVKTEKLLGKDPEIGGFGEMFLVETRAPPPPSIYGPKDSDEVEDLLDAEPGDRFNLSADEIAAFNQLKKSVTDASRQPEEASKLYWRLLRKRFETYSNAGLSAVAPYDRGDGDTAKPGAELTLALKESQMLAKYFPVLQKALMEFPKSQPEGMVHHFFWINQRVEERPTFILSHRMKLIQSEGAFLAERQYYVGHSYNSLQILAGCLPVQGGTIVFYSNRTFTDQVAGFMSGLKHGIGRKQMTEEIIKGFEEIRASAKAP